MKLWTWIQDWLIETLKDPSQRMHLFAAVAAYVGFVKANPDASLTAHIAAIIGLLSFSTGQVLAPSTKEVKNETKTE